MGNSVSEMSARRKSEGTRVKRKVIKALVITTLSIALIFWLCSLGLEESYKDFYVEKIDDYEKKDYFTLDELDFARVGNVVVVPGICATNHGEYTVNVDVYSQTGTENVIVKSVRVRDSEGIFYTQEDEEEAVFREPQDGIFRGHTKGGVFFETDTELHDHKKLYVTVQVQVENNGQKEIEEMDYEITIIQYMSHVLPT